MDINLTQTFNPVAIEQAAIESGMASEWFDPVINDKNGWFLVTNSSEFIGLLRVEQINNATLCIHPYLTPKNKRYGHEMMKEFFDLFLSYPERINKVVCFIPEYFKRTINFAHKVGFIAEGYLKDSYNRDNQFFGVCVLGITREEIEGLV